MWIGGKVKAGGFQHLNNTIINLTASKAHSFKAHIDTHTHTHNIKLVRIKEITFFPLFKAIMISVSGCTACINASPWHGRCCDMLKAVSGRRVCGLCRVTPYTLTPLESIVSTSSSFLITKVFCWYSILKNLISCGAGTMVKCK